MGAAKITSFSGNNFVTFGGVPKIGPAIGRNGGDDVAGESTTGAKTGVFAPAGSTNRRIFNRLCLPLRIQSSGVARGPRLAGRKSDCGRCARFAGRLRAFLSSCGVDVRGVGVDLASAVATQVKNTQSSNVSVPHFRLPQDGNNAVLTARNQHGSPPLTSNSGWRILKFAGPPHKPAWIEGAYSATVPASCYTRRNGEDVRRTAISTARTIPLRYQSGEDSGVGCIAYAPVTGFILLSTISNAVTDSAADAGSPRPSSKLPTKLADIDGRTTSRRM
jgi:hypothetical protein